MARERILILCGLTNFIEEFRTEKMALKCASKTLRFMMMQIGEPGAERSTTGYDDSAFLDGRLYISSVYREKGEPTVARANSEWGNKWIKEALEHQDFGRPGIPIYTLSATQIDSEKELNEFLKNGSEWFNEDKLKKIDAGERNESSNVFIVPVAVHFFSGAGLLCKDKVESSQILVQPQKRFTKH